MDSLTQVVLGAAVGEATLGKKIGNRAMLWGALAGFLPDLDVTSNLVMDDISALAVHRGITHSLFFAVLFPLLLAYIVKKLYDSGWYEKKAYRIGTALFVLLSAGITFNFLGYMVNERLNVIWISVTLLIIVGVLLLLNRYYFKSTLSKVEATYFQWYNLFFWGIITHPLLDSFTTYGTQLFLPFSDKRVAFNVISVVDPLYTLPFLIFVITASILKRTSPSRRIVNWTGIIVSSLYMLFCVFHKYQFNGIFEKALHNHDVKYERYMTTPMIMNNVLWSGIAETDSSFVQGYYSFLQEDEEAQLVNEYKKNYHLVQDYEGVSDYKTLQWFSDDYYSILKRPDGKLQYNDLRFGIMGSKFKNYNDFVFKFIMIPKNDGLDIFQSREQAEITEDSFKELWSRIMGEKLDKSMTLPYKSK